MNHIEIFFIYIFLMNEQIQLQAKSNVNRTSHLILRTQEQERMLRKLY